jgi:tripartite ATP-independent transporter DctM subunit
MSEVLIISGLFLGVLVFLYALGLPVAIAMGISSVLMMVLPFGLELNLQLISSQLFQGLNSFTLLAVPFYLLLGRLMNQVGMTEEILRFANAIVGQVKGGIAHVNIVASIIFSGMSGLALADVAGLGRIEYSAMRDQGFDKDLSLGVTGASAIIGPIIPPSVPIIIYAVLTEQSIGDLFLAGIIPGLLLGLSLILAVAVIVRRRGLVETKPFELDEFIDSFRSAFIPLLTPIVVVGGIVSGTFTATEAGAVAVLYVLLYGLVFGRLTATEVAYECRDSMVETFSLLFILAMASLYGLVALQLQLPMLIADAIIGFTSNKLVVIILIVLLLLFIGMFMDIIAAMTILVPVLLPVLTTLEINLVQFGVIMVLTLMIGTITPPFGTILFVLERVTDADLRDVVYGVALFYLPILFVLLLLIFIPELTLMVPGWS